MVRKVIPKVWFLLILWFMVILAACAVQHGSTDTNSVPAERCDLPTWNVGDYWQFLLEDKRWWGVKVTGMEGGLYITESLATRGVSGYDIRTLQKKMEVGPDGRKRQSLGGIWFQFPLYVGKRWSRMFDGSTDISTTINMLISFKVVSLEEITVPAGTFKTFKIEMEESIPGQGDSAIHHVWYSPEVKNMVKFKFFTWYGNWSGHPVSFELTSYGPKSVR
jgi:hypothetical protein